MSREVCVYPKCESTRRTRGLCHSHYQTMRAKVRAAKAAEGDLMHRGLLMEHGAGGGPKSVGNDAFDYGSTQKGDAV